MRSSTRPGQESQVDLNCQGGRYEEWRASHGSHISTHTNKNASCTVESLLWAFGEVRTENMGLEEVMVSMA